MNRKLEKTKGKILCGSNEWFENISNIALEKGEEINLWSRKGSKLNIDDYVLIHESFKFGTTSLRAIGLFVKSETLTVLEAWNSYGDRNGANNYNEFQKMIIETFDLDEYECNKIDSLKIKCNILTNVLFPSKTSLSANLEGRGQINASGRFI